MPVSKSVRLEGIPELMAAIRHDQAKTIAAMSRALYAAAQHIAQGADELVPVDTGNLRSSQQVVASKAGTKNMSVEIAYGGPVADRSEQNRGEIDTSNYALIQHEKDLNHPRGGQKKYLETPFLEEVSKWPNELMRRIRTEYYSS